MSSSLNSLWDELLTKEPEPSILMSIAQHVPPLRDKAWEQLCTHKDTTIWNLTCLISNTPALRTNGWQEIMKRKPSNDDLKKVVEKVPRIRRQAARMLLGRDLDEYALCAIIHRSPRYRERAWEALSPKKPHPHHLVTIIEKVPTLRRRAWEQMKLHEDAVRFYSNVVENVEELLVDAAQLIVEGKPSVDDLYKVITYSPQHAETAGRQLLDKTEANSRTDSVLHVIRHVESLQEVAVDKLFTMKKSTTDTFTRCLSCLKGEVLERVARHVSDNAGENQRVVLASLVKYAPTPQLRDTAGRELLKLAPRNEDLLSLIIKRCPSLRDDAWDLVTAAPLADSVIEELAKMVPAIQEKATAWLRKPRVIVSEMKQLARQHAKENRNKPN